MAHEYPIESGKRLAADFRRIREMRGITVSELFEQTRVLPEVIAKFEDSALFNHELFNRVYLRALVSQFAKIMGIYPDLALESLEEAFLGVYSGRLGKEYLEEFADEAKSEHGRGKDRGQKPPVARLRERSEVLLV